MQPRVLVLRAPGTNCDLETAFAFEQCGAQADRVHINRLLESPATLDAYQIFCLPGGFSYGDDLAAGRILASQIRERLADMLHRFRDGDRLMLGICNGFQVLIQTGMLLNDSADRRQATLCDNDSGRFEDRWVRLSADGSRCVMLAGLDELELPVAHAEGKFVTQDEATFQELESQGQLVLRYLPAPAAGSAAADNGLVPYPDNPNGSLGNVAGICDASGRVLGLMPHPERFIDPTHHPRWTREPERTTGDGLKLFENAVAYFR